MSGAYVRQSIPSAGFGEGTSSSGIAGRLGLEALMGFYMYSALVGAAYQIRAGTITAPLVGSVAIAATGAEMCVDAPTSATTIMPVNFNVSMRLMTGTLHEYAVKSITGASTAGTLFTPLPLKSIGAGAVSTARVAATAGTVTVPTETAALTRRHWSGSNPAAGATTSLPTGLFFLDWTPRAAPVPTGPWVLYVQVAATTTGPSYYAALDYLEYPSAALL